MSVSKVSAGGIVIKARKISTTKNRKGVCSFCKTKMSQKRVFTDTLCIFDRDSHDKTIAALETESNTWELDENMYHRKCMVSHIEKTLYGHELKYEVKRDHIIVDPDSYRLNTKYYFGENLYKLPKDREYRNGVLDTFIDEYLTYKSEYIELQHKMTFKVQSNCDLYVDLDLVDACDGSIRLRPIGDTPSEKSDNLINRLDSFVENYKSNRSDIISRLSKLN